jgi:hypothetical protein
LLERPFWERYPSKYREKDGAQVFRKLAFVSEMHETYLDEKYFRIMGQISRNPRYLNKRIMDPQIKCFLDEVKFELPPEWGLPAPNPDAAYKSLAKYGKPILHLTEEQVKTMNKAWEMTQGHFTPYLGKSKVLEYEEAKAHLDMSTSSGSPFNLQYPTKGELFEKDEEIDEWLKADWETMATDPEWTCLFTNALKEELRLASKILKNSIRTFLSGGVDAVVHGTRLFVDQNEKMYAAHLVTASAVGMSPLKGNWNELFKKLNIFKYGFALDESEYDSSLRDFLMWGCARMRWFWLDTIYQTPQNLARVRVYYRNLVHTVVVTPEGVLVMKETGNPSGSVNTINDNTFMLYTLLAYAWLRLAPKGMRNLASFELHTSKALVGDDNTWTVSEEALVFFNATSVIEVWKELGVTTTTDTLEPRRASELDFLSANTVFLKGRAVPIYNRTKLMTSLLYAPALHLTPAITLERTAAMLSIGWTDLPFRHFCRELISWLMDKYDRVMRDDPRWITAKTQVKHDLEYERLFLGNKNMLLPQSVFGRTVKLSQPNKRTMQSSKPRRNGKKPGKKTKKIQQVQVKPGGRLQIEAIGARQPKKKFIGPKPPNRRQRRQNLRPKVVGQGGYYDASGSYQRGFAPNYGSQLGSVVGNGFQSLAEVLGFGDYEVKSNSLSQLLMGNGPPAIANLGKGDATVVAHREYIGDLVTGPLVGGSSEFTLLEYNINPGTSTLFPWLSEMAGLFQFYEMNGMIIELKTSSSNYAANMALGTMFVATNYNSLDNAPVNKIELLNMEFSTSSKPSESQMHLVECARKYTVQDKLYITPDSNYKGGDPRLYNLGTTFIGSYGCPVAETTIAEIWVSYEVSLYRPIPAIANNEALDAIFTTGTFGGTFPFGGAIGDYSLVAGSSSVYTLDTTSLANHMYVRLPNRQGAYKVTFTGSVNPINTAGMSWTTSSVSATDCRLLPTYQNTAGILNTVNVKNVTAAVGTQFIWEIVVAVDALAPVGVEPFVDFVATFASPTYGTSNATVQITQLEYSFWSEV